MQLLLRASDVLCDIVNAARQEQELAGDFGADLVAAMEEALHGAANLAPAPAHPAATVAASDEEGARRSWHIRFAPHTELLQKANEPLLLVRQLRRLGDLVIEADACSSCLINPLMRTASSCSRPASVQERGARFYPRQP
jgi:two-component system chemotaxis sensor kinase CheA